MSPSFAKGPTPAAYTPFGKNVYLRSTQDVKYEHFTVAATSITAQTIDGVAGQKILQPGTVLAKITSAAGTSTAADVGKVGPFQAGVTDGRQTVANIVGINDTFLPWQLMHRDVEVAVAVEARVVQAWCVEYDAAGASIALTNTTATAMVGQKALSILFS
jgi:hypothetical protein